MSGLFSQKFSKIKKPVQRWIWILKMTTQITANEKNTYNNWFIFRQELITLCVMCYLIPVMFCFSFRLRFSLFIINSLLRNTVLSYYNLWKIKEIVKLHPLEHLWKHGMKPRLQNKSRIVQITWTSMLYPNVRYNKGFCLAVIQFVA